MKGEEEKEREGERERERERERRKKKEERRKKKEERRKKRGEKEKKKKKGKRRKKHFDKWRSWVSPPSRSEGGETLPEGPEGQSRNVLRLRHGDLALRDPMGGSPKKKQAKKIKKIKK